MKKTFVLFISLAVMIFAFAGCGSNDVNTTTADDTSSVAESPAEETEAEEPSSPSPSVLTSYDEVETALGLENGTEQFFTMIGATYGMSYESDGVELYEFDSEDNEGMKSFIDTSEGAAIKNGRFVLFVYDNASEELIQQFKDLKTE